MIKLVAILFASTLMWTATAVAGNCDHSQAKGEVSGKLVMYVGVDISGSFRRQRKDSLNFIAHYIYAHLHGCGGFKKLRTLFVGSIGGAKPDEPKSFFPIENFKYKSIEGIKKELNKIFPANKTNQYTDFNAFFDQVAKNIKNKKLVMKPIDIVLLSDGVPDAPKVKGKHDFRSLKLKPLENLSRRITVRVLYTSAVSGNNWQENVPRNRVRVWTQDADIMKSWRAKDIFIKGKAFKDQDRFFSWVKQNVDWSARKKTVK